MDIIGFSTFFLILSWLVATALLPRRSKSTKAFWTLTLIAFLPRAVLAIADSAYPILPTLYRLDAGGYDTISWLMATAWRSSDVPPTIPWSFDVAAYLYLHSAVYFAVGHSLPTVRMLSALVGALSVSYLYLIARECIGDRRAGVLAFIMVFWPSHILWTSQNLRDPWVFYFLSRVLYASIACLKNLNWRNSVAFVAYGTAAAVFRLATGWIVAIAVPLVLMSLSWHRKARFVLWVVVLLVGLMLITSQVTTTGEFLHRVSVVRQGLAVGGSAYYPEQQYDSLLDVITFAPTGVFYFLLAPFPWQPENLWQSLAALESVVVALLMLFAIIRFPAMLRLVRLQKLRFVLVFLIIGILVYAIAEGNVGTGYRHKMQFLPYLLLIFAAGWPVLPRISPASHVVPALSSKA